MPEIKLVHGCMLYAKIVSEEVGAICRIHCEAEFTSKAASVLKVDGPDKWPAGWTGGDLGIEDMSVTSVSFAPEDGQLPGLAHPMAVNTMTDFKVKAVSRGPQKEVRKVLTFTLKTGNLDSALDATRWGFTNGDVECAITITHPTQGELEKLREKETGQMSIGDAHGAAADAIKIVKGKAN